ncbi:binding-protein-dependent transport systems inner membrane component [Candidatus Vecturithrix granuli]|uniref:Binding-protein-dependent transport systems inner membrane component n=1 Tax=Vecturithrix granuli TaxID=1499967 RepID=A0A081C4R7_VECG1|nr:binding-protein-dependent transport systems inner membrane component [Candidatus Vecturithrix granuli]
MGKTWTGYLLFLPTILVLGILILLPIIEAMGWAFTDFNVLKDVTKYIGLGNFAAMNKDATFWTALFNSLLLTTVVILLQYILGLGLAVTLKQKVPGIGIFRSVVMASWVIPVISTVIMFRFMSQPDYGFFNILLEKIGLGKYATYWFGSLAGALPMIIIMHLWRNIPFYGIGLLAAMQAIPNDYYEAAEIDGASAWQKFLYITFPGVRYMSMVIITIHVIWTFNNFDFIFLSTGGGPVNVTQVLPVYIYIQSWHHFAMGYASAIGLVMLLILLVFSFIYMRFNKEPEV